MLLKDARDYQILFLSLFLILGIGTRDWSLRPDLMLAVILTCLVTQVLAMKFGPALQTKFAQFLRKPFFEPTQTQPFSWHCLKSALITGLGLCLLLRADHLLTMMLAGFCAILSKFIFKFEEKHFFNPGNFGIILALLLSNDAWVSPGQWGEEWWYALLFIGTGCMVLKKVGRWDTTAAFLGVYAALEAGRNLWLGWTWDVWIHRLMSGSLLLFALFMITDPRAIPNAKLSRIIWAGCVAILAFILRNQFYMPTAIFWALFMLSPLTLIFDMLWKAPQFSWQSSGRKPLISLNS
jgi:Na+-transporting NADH:ubiquinone oxidoreductase subunit NqrB